MKVLRWILIVPAVLAVILVVTALGTGIAEWAASRCPAEGLAAGVCVAPFHVSVLDAVIFGGVALAAAVAVAVGGLIAPGRKLVGGIIAFLLVCLPLAAAWFVMGGNGFPLGNTRDQVLQLLLVAVVAGALCLTWVRTWRSVSH